LIYQHRQVVARGGKLEQRHAAFKNSIASLDEHGSVLIGAWEVLIGPDAGCAVYQLRQFDGMAAWEQHQDRVRADAKLSQQRTTTLFPHLDFVDTAIVRQADDNPPLPETWPAIDAIRGLPCGYVDQRILSFRPGAAVDHHELYFRDVMPALERDGARFIGLFDTMIGPGTTNANSHRSVELRQFPDLASWQRWRDAQDSEPALRELIKRRWLGLVERVDSVLMRTLDYSRIR
jgi:hypothetical protein